MAFRFNPLGAPFDIVTNKSGASDNPLIVSKVAGENLSALQWVKLSDKDTVVLGDVDTYANSQVIGITLGAATAGSSVEVQTFGLLEDAFFNYTLNEPLFLGSLGTTILNPSAEIISMNVGHGLGSGAIFIDIKEQIETC